MDSILHKVPCVFIYLDDILIASETEEQHIADRQRLFDSLEANSLIVNHAKCVLSISSIDFLGYSVTTNGIAPLPDKVATIHTFP